MKLIYCEKCKDLVKLTRHEIRKCRCGHVRGKYRADGGRAVVSPSAISVVIGNPQLRDAIRRLRTISKETPKADKAAYKERAAIELTYVRPNEGPGNPRTKVKKKS
jgi:hypothetical protein